MNKKSQAADMITLISLFVAMLIVASAIASGVFIFFGTGYESHQNDALALNAKISRCLLDEKFTLTQNTLTPTESFYSSCSLNKEVIEKHFTIQIIINEKENMNLGDSFYCNLDVKDKSNLPKCASSELILSNEKIKITTSTKQEETKKLA